MRLVCPEGESNKPGWELLRNQLIPMLRQQLCCGRGPSTRLTWNIQEPCVSVKLDTWARPLDGGPYP